MDDFNFDFDMSEQAFDLDDAKTFKKKQKDLIKKQKIKIDKIITKSLKNIEDIVGLQLPGKNEQLRIITTKSFNSISLLKYVIKQIGAVDECYISTLNSSAAAVENLINFIKQKQIKKLTLIVCNINNFHKRRIEDLERLEEMEEATCIGTHNHSKIIIAKNKKHKVVIEGSGNLTSNQRIEQYLIEQSDIMFDFHQSWMSSLPSIFPDCTFYS